MFSKASVVQNRQSPQGTLSLQAASTGQNRYMAILSCEKALLCKMVKNTAKNALLGILQGMT